MKPWLRLVFRFAIVTQDTSVSEMRVKITKTARVPETTGSVATVASVRGGEKYNENRRLLNRRDDSKINGGGHN